jgi:hypothetical protein
MTEPIPEQTSEPVDVEVNYETDEKGLRVTATLGDAAIMLDHAWGADAAHSATILVNALPNIMTAVQEAIHANQEEAQRG